MAALMAVLSVDQMVLLKGRQTVAPRVVQKDIEWETLWVDLKAVCLDSAKVGPMAASSDYSKVSKMAHVTADQRADRMESPTAAVSDHPTAGKTVAC